MIIFTFISKLSFFIQIGKRVKVSVFNKDCNFHFIWIRLAFTIFTMMMVALMMAMMMTMIVVKLSWADMKFKKGDRRTWQLTSPTGSIWDHRLEIIVRDHRDIYCDDDDDHGSGDDTHCDDGESNDVECGGC